MHTTPVFEGKFFAWQGPTFCDDDDNAYFLAIPQVAPAGTPGEDDPFNPRDVLRVSFDGKKKTTFNPTASSKLTGATEVATHTTALDRNGTLFMLVWARWAEEAGKPSKSGQYIVSFNQKGEYRSTVEVDSQEILVEQFEVFGSGEFLLRGRRSNTADARIAILSPGGGSLHDVVGWPGFPSAPLGDPAPTTKFDQMVRGGDGRIYVAQQEAQQHRDVVYAFGQSGETEEVFKLRMMPRHPQLMGWKAAGNRFAAAYLEAENRTDAAPGDLRGKWWIAVYSNVTDASAIETTVYGPAPGPPICFQHKGSRDTFTFLTDGAKLVSMSSP